MDYIEESCGLNMLLTWEQLGQKERKNNINRISFDGDVGRYSVPIQGKTLYEIMDLYDDAGEDAGDDEDKFEVASGGNVTLIGKTDRRSMVLMLIEVITAQHQVAIELTTWDMCIHCFVLTMSSPSSPGLSWKEPMVSITDSYINVRGVTTRPFDIELFVSFLCNPTVEAYNRLFMCDDEVYQLPPQSSLLLDVIF